MKVQDASEAKNEAPWECVSALDQKDRVGDSQ